MKAIIYARVSKEEEGLQDPQNQIQPLMEWSKGLGYELGEVFIDKVSGGTSDRPEFKRMMGLAAQHRFDIILIWALDRFSRESLSNTLNYIERLKKANVGLKSYQESWLDTTNEGTGQLLLAIFAWVASFERKRISERTKAALQKRKNLGMILGRPRKTPPPCFVRG